MIVGVPTEKKERTWPQLMSTVLFDHAGVHEEVGPRKWRNVCGARDAKKAGRIWTQLEE